MLKTWLPQLHVATDGFEIEDPPVALDLASSTSRVSRSCVHCFKPFPAVDYLGFRIVQTGTVIRVRVMAGL
jgi:hypothetical protein